MTTFSNVYPNLAKWCAENDIRNATELYNKIKETTGQEIKYSTLITRLSGERAFNNNEIDTLIKLTGLPYELLFKKLGE